MKSLISISTVILLGLILAYHALEVQVRKVFSIIISSCSDDNDDDDELWWWWFLFLLYFVFCSIINRYTFYLHFVQVELSVCFCSFEGIVGRALNIITWNFIFVSLSQQLRHPSNRATSEVLLYETKEYNNFHDSWFLFCVAVLWGNGTKLNAMKFRDYFCTTSTLIIPYPLHICALNTPCTSLDI